MAEGPFWIEYKKETLKQTADCPRKKSSRKPAQQTENLSERGQKLFEELRKLRYELARKRGIPPYMVFSDKTLRDMCIRLPLTEEELLDVNGMGEKKLEQYGGSFLEKIKAVTGGDQGHLGDSGTMSSTRDTESGCHQIYCNGDHALQSHCKYFHGTGDTAF